MVGLRRSRTKIVPGGDHVRGTCDDSCTIVGKHDFVVIVRHWRQHGPVRRADAWLPAAVSDDPKVAATMAQLIMSANRLDEARALSHSALVRELSTEDRERIFGLLQNRTTADTARAAALHKAALARLTERRDGIDRRSGSDRRKAMERRHQRSEITASMRAAGERRTGIQRRRSSDRRSGSERREGPGGEPNARALQHDPAPRPNRAGRVQQA